MTLKDLENIPMLQTRSIAEACQDPQTLGYVSKCMLQFINGQWGDLDREDIEANNEDLKDGYGHVLARYPFKYALENDIYIETHFDKDHINDINYTQTMIMYVDER